MCFKREEVVASLSYGSFKSRNHVALCPMRFLERWIVGFGVDVR
jgi:hypothetical protein